MGLLSSNKKKGNEQLRTLSEKEIQDKLYGSYRSSTSTVRDEYTVKPQPSAKLNVSIAIPSLESRDLFKSATLTKPEPPAQSFSRTESFDKTREKETARFKAPDSSVDEKLSRDRLKSENRPKSTGRGSASALVQVGGAVIQVLRILGNALFTGLRVIISVLTQLFVVVDFRKAKVRTAAYWLGGVLILAGLLFGIHHLNVRREVAMKAPRKKVAAPAFFGFKKNESKLPAVAEVAPVEVPAEPVPEENSAEVQPAEANKGPHVIQVATFATEEDAKRLAAKIKEGGMPSFVKPLTRSTGKVYYCVFIGRFLTSQDAEKKLEQFKKREVSRSFQDAFVRSLD